MTEFIFGLSGSARRAHVLDRIREALQAEKKVLVISPEQQALVWDTVSAREFGAAAALQIETLSFTRLADSLFRRYGGCAKNYITDAKKSLLMWSAINAVKDKLAVYGKGREDRFVPLMLKAVSEAKLYSKTPLMLQEVAEKLSEEGREAGLSARLFDLSVIWSAYEKLMSDAYDDPEEIPDALCELLERVDPFENTAVFVDSFYTLTPKEKRIVRRIFSTGADVYITFDMSAEDTDSLHCEHIREYRNSMARAAMRAGREFSVYDAGVGEGDAAIRYLRENLWNYSAPAFEGDTSSVALFGCGDRYDEAQVLAARIGELVSGGAEYSDIAVVCADTEKLEGIVEAQLEALDIPVYMSKKSKLCSQGAMRLILAAASVVAGGWRREDVLALAKTGLTPLNPKECDALERYAEKWRLRGKKAFVTDGWNMNMLGYTDRRAEWAEEMLAVANDAREKLICPLERFAGSLGKTVEDACRGAYELLSDYGVYGKIKKDAARLRANGEGAAAQEAEQVWNALQGVLDTMVEVAGGQPAEPARFASLIRRVAETVELGTIPDSQGSVVICNASSARFSGAKHVIILGAIEGEFPMVPTDNGFFCERDKEVLRDFGMELSPGMDMKRSEELFRFWSAVSAPTETLTVIVCERDGAETRHPSLGCMRIEKLLSKTVVPNVHLDYEYLLQNESAARYYRNQLRGSEMGEAIDSLLGREGARGEYSDGGYISEDIARELFSGRMVMSQSKFEKFQDCPLSYYLRYVLKLDEGESAKVSHVDVGNFVHKILEDVLSEVKAEGNEYPFDEEKIQKKTEELIEKYIDSVMPEGERSGRHSYLFSRISRSLAVYLKSLNREFTAAAFKPEAFEMKVGLGDAPVPPLDIDLGDGDVMSMCGVVDRVDIYRGENNVYVRVADYKTGSKKFSLDKTLEGRNIQLLLYLFSICMAEDSEFKRSIAPSGERLVPAGAVYFSAQPGQVSSEAPLDVSEAEEKTIDSISRTGIVLRDEAVVRAMDPDGNGRYSPVKLKRDGELASGAKTEEEFGEICDTLCGVMREVGVKMKSGCAAASPTEHDGRLACEFCRMKPVCRLKREVADSGTDTVE